MLLSYTLNPSSLTSFPNSGGMLPVSCQQFHGASCGLNHRERAYTYRIELVSEVVPKALTSFVQNDIRC